MKKLIPLLLTISLLVVSFPVFSQRSMGAIKWSLNFDLDATVRCVGSGTTTIPATPIDGDQLIISLDPDGTDVLLQMSDSANLKPTVITAASAHWHLKPGQEIVFDKIPASASQSTWDARHIFAVGSGKLRVKTISTRSNVTPS